MQKQRPYKKVQVTMTPEQYEEVKAAASAKSLKMAALVRMVFFQALREGK